MVISTPMCIHIDNCEAHLCRSHFSPSSYAITKQRQCIYSQGVGTKMCWAERVLKRSDVWFLKITNRLITCTPCMCKVEHVLVRQSWLKGKSKLKIFRI